MKIIVCCLGGVCRSVGLCDILRNDHGIDAFAVGLCNTTAEGQAFLYEWADRIIVVEPQDAESVPEQYQETWSNAEVWNPKWDAKRKVIDIGPDVWGKARHPELRAIWKAKIDEVIG